MPVQINGKMIEISLLQPRKWNALKELERSRMLGLKEEWNRE